MAAAGTDETEVVLGASPAHIDAMDHFGGFAALRRTTAKNVETSRLLCEDSRLIAKELAAQRDVRAAAREQRSMAARPRHGHAP